MMKQTAGVGTHKSSDQRSDLVMIYFKQVTEFDGTDLRIKVGKTGRTVDRRLKEHRANSLGGKRQPIIEKLCGVQGKGTDENILKNHFAGIRRGAVEIFEPADELVDYIRWLRDQNFVWVPGDPQCEDEWDLPLVDASLWLPGPGRTKPGPKTLFPDLYGPLNLPPREMTADDFYTNEIIIEKVRELMGAIDLDPASIALADRVVKAAKFYTIHDNGLEQKWGGRVWLNPPFSQWKLWVPKIISEWRSGRITEMCVLAAMRTLSAQYFNRLLVAADAMCILKGRLPFWGGVAGDSPDDGHSVFYFGKNRKGFRDAFSVLGAVFFGSEETRL